MKKDLAEVIWDALDNAGIGCSLREDYSGRGMFGKTTSGVVADASVTDVLSAVIENADLFVDSDGYTTFKIVNISMDNMGEDIILY